jgi:hypothetical protein
MLPKSTSTRCIQLPEIGVKWRYARGFLIAPLLGLR